ncbi:hypothetical protein FRC10_004947 [Ceratobasidium sp. 414]|nr:hypothetical protein FRC10_004947 [Ceratobasidium sp. 414]
MDLEVYSTIVEESEVEDMTRQEDDPSLKELTAHTILPQTPQRRSYTSPVQPTPMVPHTPIRDSKAARMSQLFTPGSVPYQEASQIKTPEQEAQGGVRTSGLGAPFTPVPGATKIIGAGPGTSGRSKSREGVNTGRSLLLNQLSRRLCINPLQFLVYLRMILNILLVYILAQLLNLLATNLLSLKDQQMQVQEVADCHLDHQEEEDHPLDGQEEEGHRIGRLCLLTMGLQDHQVNLQRDLRGLQEALQEGPHKDLQEDLQADHQVGHQVDHQDH